MRKILKNAYVLSGIIVFLILFFTGLWLDFSLIESGFASAAIAAIGVGGIWWKNEVW